MALEILAIPSGPLPTNAYLVCASEEAWAVDPAPGSAQPLLKAARERNARITRIINTHGHWDHVTDNAALRKATGAPIAIHAQDAPMLGRSEFSRAFIPSHPDDFLESGQVLNLGRYVFRVLHTPGHTAGSICLLERGVLLSGDTLFRGAHGRTDLPGGSDEEMRASLRKLATLPRETIVYPGHGEQTTIGEEFSGR